MTTLELSEFADRLIKGVPFDKQRPTYSEDSFRRKLSRNHRQERKLKRIDRDLDAAAGHLYETELQTAIRLAALTEKQALVLVARIRGETFEQIGSRLGATKQAACKLFLHARRKLRIAWRQNPYRGLHQVYRAEVSRTSKWKSQQPTQTSSSRSFWGKMP